MAISQHLGLRRGRRRQGRTRSPSSCWPRPARSAATVTAVFGGDGDASPRSSAPTAPPRSTPPATSAGSCPASPVATAIAADQRRQTPDLLLLGTTYEGRDVAARLSVKLDKPVLTQQRRRRASTATPSSSPPRSSAAPSWCARSSPAPARTSSLVRPEVVRRRAVGRRRRRRSRRSPWADPGAAGAPRSSSATSRRPPGPKLDEAADRRLRWAGPGRGGQVRDDRGPWPSCSRGRRAPPGPSSTPAGCPTATRSARPARS